MRIDRILGDPIELLGYAPETAIAEKGVTILERGITSTRWRDYVDIVQFARQGIDADELLLRAGRSPLPRGSTRACYPISGWLRRGWSGQMDGVATKRSP